MSLSDFLAEEPPDYDVHTFRVDSLELATWAMRKLAKARASIDEAKEQALAESRKIDDWFARSTKSAQDDVTFFTNALSQYMMELRAEGKKSLVLPDGEIQSRSVPSKAEVEDIELFLKWCLNNHREGWIRTKESANLEALKGAVRFEGENVVDETTGEIIEGLIGVQSQVHVSVKVVS